jgi:hypothetical protein
MNFLNPLSFDPTTADPNDPNFVLSPLADPVAGAIFANAEVAGLASESFINAVHKAENETGIMGKIIRVTPQRSHSSPTSRGCRVDVETETDANEYIRYEVQISPDSHIMVRDLFSAAHLFTEKSVKGDTSSQLAKKMPKVIYINILGYILRKTNTDLVQPFKVMYTKPPEEVAIPNFGGYNIQLPRLLEMEANFEDDLYCWCYALYTAHLEKKTIQEVVAMTPGLQAFAERDAGFRQFNERYETVSADPQTRREYAMWFDEALREEGMLDWARQEGRDEVMPRLAESEQQRLEAEQKLKDAEQRRKDEMVSAARVMKDAGLAIATIKLAFPSLAVEIEEL